MKIIRPFNVISCAVLAVTAIGAIDVHSMSTNSPLVSATASSNAEGHLWTDYGTPRNADWLTGIQASYENYSSNVRADGYSITTNGESIRYVTVIEFSDASSSGFPVGRYSTELPSGQFQASLRDISTASLPWLTNFSSRGIRVRIYVSTYSGSYGGADFLIGIS